MLLLAFGPGLTIETVLVEVHDSAGRILRGTEVLADHLPSGRR
jgi:hypothetical protein